MKYVGAVLLLLGALASCKLYTAYMNVRLKEHTEYLRLLKHLRNKISCYLVPIEEAVLGFSSECIVQNRFLSSLKAGAAAKEAYQRARENSLLSLEANRLLTELFSDFGAGYLDTEIKKMDFAIEKLSDICDQERLEAQKKIKLVGTLIFAAVFGFIILIF